MHNHISPVFLWTITTCNTYGLCEGWIIPCVSHVSRALMDFSLKLDWYCVVRQVNWFIHCGQDCVLEAVTKT